MYKDILNQDQNIRVAEALSALAYLATDLAEQLNFLAAEELMRRQTHGCAKRADALRYLAVEASLFASGIDKLGDEVSGENTEAILRMTAELVDDAEKLNAALAHYQGDNRGLIDPLTRLKAFFHRLFGRRQEDPEEFKQVQALLQAVTAINAQVSDLQARTFRRWADQTFQARSA